MGQLRGLFRFQNVDSTRDLNSRFSGLTLKGVMDPGATHPSGAGQVTTPVVVRVPNQLAVDILPFMAVGSDGMVVVHDAPPYERLGLISNTANQYVLVRTVYQPAGPADVAFEVRTSSDWAALSASEKDKRIILAKVTTGVTQIADDSGIDLRENDIVDKFDRYFVRGVVQSSAMLPIDSPTAVKRVKTGDVYLVIDDRQFYRWSGSTWETVTDQLVASDLKLHKGVNGPSPILNQEHAGAVIVRDAEGYPSHVAKAISFNNGYGGSFISATNVQDAIAEIDVEKVKRAGGDTMSGTYTVTGSVVSNASGSTVAMIATSGASASAAIFGQGQGTANGIWGFSSSASGSIAVIGEGQVSSVGTIGGQFSGGLNSGQGLIALGSSGAAATLIGGVGIISQGGIGTGAGLGAGTISTGGSGGGDGVIGQGFGSDAPPTNSRTGVVGQGGSSGGIGVLGMAKGATFPGDASFAGVAGVSPAGSPGLYGRGGSTIADFTSPGIGAKIYGGAGTFNNTAGAIGVYIEGGPVNGTGSNVIGGEGLWVIGGVATVGGGGDAIKSFGGSGTKVINPDISTTLNGAINSSVTTITVPSNGTKPFGFPGIILIDDEQISYTGITTTTFTGCVRGVNGTTAASHSNSATVSGVISPHGRGMAAVGIAGGAQSAGSHGLQSIGGAASGNNALGGYGIRAVGGTGRSLINLGGQQVVGGGHGVWAWGGEAIVANAYAGHGVYAKGGNSVTTGRGGIGVFGVGGDSNGSGIKGLGGFNAGIGGEFIGGDFGNGVTATAGTSGGIGVSGTGTLGAGVRGEALGAGISGMIAQGGPTGGAGISATGGSGGGTGVVGSGGSSGGYGVRGFGSGAGAVGVYGTPGTGGAPAAGVWGDGNATGSYGVYATANTNNGTALFVQSSGNSTCRGVEIRTTAPATEALRIEGDVVWESGGRAVYYRASDQAVSSGVSTDITLPTTAIAAAGGISFSSPTFTLTNAGMYRVSYSISVDDPGSPNLTTTRVLVNGGPYTPLAQTTQYSGGGIYTVSASSIVSAAASDTLKLNVITTTAGVTVKLASVTVERIPTNV